MARQLPATWLFPTPPPNPLNPPAPHRRRRSDSNGEDLEGYAGAGLYESITTAATRTVRVDYMEDALARDAGARNQLLSRICRLGADIEAALGSAQDIEGVVGADGAITVVQTRPQV
jgi:alpha-glucan,water dikinase